MEKSYLLLLVTSLAVQFSSTYAVESHPSSTYTRNIVAEFNPYISVLDYDNTNKYTIDELVPLVQLIATQFKRILIRMDITELMKTGNLSLSGQRASILYSAVAAARYNCRPSTQNKVEVVLLIRKDTRRSCNCYNSIKTSFEEFANEANIECNGTVSTILVSEAQFCNNRALKKCLLQDKNSNYQNDLSLNQYKWGIYTSFLRYCNYTIRSSNLYWDPAVVLLDYDDNEMDMQINLTQCNSYNESNDKPAEFIKEILWTDRQKNRVINMSNLVAKWEKHISQLHENSFILVQAFDYTINCKNTYGCLRDQTFRYFTGGWWFWFYDKFTRSVVLKEKIKVAGEIDSEESPMNYDWLKEKLIFGANSSGILDKRDTMLTYITQSGFCRVIRYQLDYTTQRLFEALRDTSTALCGQNARVIFSSRFTTKEDFNEEFKENNVTLLLDLSENFVIQDFNPITVEFDYYYINTTNYIKVLEDVKQTGGEYGFLFSIKLCENYEKLDEKSQRFVFDLIGDLNSTMNVFLYSEGRDDVTYGAINMLTRRISLFEECRLMVLKSGNTMAELGFAMKGYYKLDDFDRTPWVIQNYVKYVKILSEWASTQVNTVVYVGTLQNEEQDSNLVVGWLTLDHSETGFTTKQHEALRLSKWFYPDPIYRIVTKVNVETSVGLNINQIVIGVCSAVIFCLIIVLIATYIIRAYYKNDRLPEEEIDLFFNGNDMSDLEADKLPYDQNKYEIQDSAFSFDKDEPLGCGEFGMVFRGSVKTANGEVTVAMKTTNSNTRHNTTLKGFLSEIKVLAHVGKHVNIIDLLGANTSSLKDGKVYIFLELCQLGSLEKYLRENRRIENFSNDNSNFDSPNIGKRYISVSELTTNKLNNCLSDDLYRWSIEICNGMAYLAEKHVVHADLATRNILLNSLKNAKICDFGLSRRMYNYTNYVKTGQEPLPWKWMAPEALRYLKFDERTDVWSYGVTLWEIYSLGSVPYPGLSWDLNFPQMLERGFRLAKPEYLERDMYQVMQNCWKINPEQRPTFSEILLDFAES